MNRTITTLALGTALFGGVAATAGPAAAAPELVTAVAQAPTFVSEDDGHGGMLLLANAYGSGRSYTSGDPSVRKVTVIIQEQDDTMPDGWTGIGSGFVARWKHPVVKLAKQTGQHEANCLRPVRTVVLVTDRLGKSHKATSEWVSGLSQPACAVFGGGVQTVGNSWTRQGPRVVQTGAVWDSAPTVKDGNSWT